MLDPQCRLVGNRIFLGEPCRIDAFAVLTGHVRIGRRVHVSTGARLLGGGGMIHLSDGSFVSPGATLLTASDDFAAGYAVGPLFPEANRRVLTGDVILGPFAGVGAHSVVMPGCSIGWGARVGACSFVNESVPPGEIWAGCPARKVGSIDLDRLAALAAELFPDE